MLWVHNIPIDGEEYKWVNIWKVIYFYWGERYVIFDIFTCKNSACSYEHILVISGISWTFSVGGQLVFTGRQNFPSDLLYKKTFPLDG